jgi:hypothetical protein
MEPLTIKPKEDAPEVHLDKETATFKISGNSFCEDPEFVYQKVLKWMDEYKKDPLPETIFEFRMNYINTASSKQIAEILIKLKSMEANSDIKVLWHYQNDDDEMLDEGRGLKMMINLDFEFLEY